jgi:hypothetical protein
LLALGLYLLSRRLDPEARPFNLLALLHHWLPAFVIALMFFELGVLIPLMRDYNDLRYDHALQAIDLWLLGDPVAFVERHAAPCSMVFCCRAPLTNGCSQSRTSRQMRSRAGMR